MPRPHGKRLAALAVFICLLAGPAGAAPAPVVRVESGALSGDRTGRILVYRGIPYAAAPVGQLRWRPPAPALRWSGVRRAERFGPACAQPVAVDGAPNFGGYSGPSSEDCLTLNVWTPARASAAPVMVWIHGGGHRFGAASMPLYDGAAFARDGVVLVSFNYRLGGLGYFAHPALTAEASPRQPLGDYGLMDEIAALAWVRRNIAAFGGDPARVTVFGQSSSAIDVQALMAIPAASALFRQAIVESGGSWVEPTGLAAREADGLKLAAAAGLTGGAVPAAALRKLPASALFDPGFTLDFQPFLDGRLLVRTSTQAFACWRASAKPLVIGSNSFEGAVARDFSGIADLAAKLGSLYPGGGKGEAALRALDGDRFFGAPTRWVAARNARRAPTWLYRFSYVPEALRGVLPGAPHGFETPFVFDSWDVMPAVMRAAFSGSPAGPTAQDRAMTARIHGCWVAFAKSGRPDCEGAPAWPAYDSRSDRLMEFGANTGVRAGLDKLRDDAIEQVVLPDLLRAP